MNDHDLTPRGSRAALPRALGLAFALAAPAVAEAGLSCDGTFDTGQITLGSTTLSGACGIAAGATATLPDAVFDINSGSVTNRGTLNVFGRWQNGFGGMPVKGQSAQLINDGTSAKILVQGTTGFDILQNLGLYGVLMNENGATIDITGRNTTLFNGEEATVDNKGKDTTLTIEQGALFESATGYLTNETRASIIVTGAGSRLMHTIDPSITYGGLQRELKNQTGGTILVTNGGTFDLYAAIAHNQDGGGIYIDGAGSELHAHAGATLTNDGSTGNLGSSLRVYNEGLLLIEGAQTVFQNTGYSTVFGDSGAGSGVSGTIRNTDHAQISFSGANTMLNLGANFELQNDATASITIANASILYAGGARIDNGGTLTNNGATVLLESSAYDPNAGPIAAVLANASAASLVNSGGGTWTIGAGGRVELNGVQSTFTNQDVGTRFEIAAGGTLSLNGASGNLQTTMFQNLTGAAFHNAGTVAIDAGGAAFYSTAGASNDGRFELTGGRLRNEDSGVFDNRASGVIVSSLGTILNSGTFTNEGEISNLGTITNLGAFTTSGRIHGGGHLANLGTLTVADDGSVAFATELSAPRAAVLGSTLASGNWQFQTSTGHTATLAIYDPSNQYLPELDTLGSQATLGIAGSGAVAFAQFFAHFTVNEGRLQIGKDAVYTPLDGLVNRNALDVLSGGTLANAAGTTLRNDGTITNAGLVDFAGSLTGTGQIDNRGIVRVESGATIATRTPQLSGNTLAGGRWDVVGTQGEASLALLDGSGATPDISTLGTGAEVWLSGKAARFDQLTGALRTNDGKLGVGPDYTYAVTRNLSNGGTIEVQNVFEVAPGVRVSGAGLIVNDGPGQVVVDGLYASRIANQGTVTVDPGGVANVSGSDSYDPLLNSLTQGRWEITSDARSAGRLQFDGAVNVIGAHAELVLHGKFAQTPGNALHRIDGRLTVDGGQSYAPTGTFDNEGVLYVGAGGTVNIASPYNYAVLNGHATLKGGEWEVVGGATTSPADLATLTLAGGAPVSVLAANTGVLLKGVGSRFDQFERGIADIKGALAVGDGRTFSPRQSLVNEGTISMLRNGAVALARSPNFGGGVLAGGTWDVMAGDGTATLSIGDTNGGVGAIDTLAAQTVVLLSGAGARFDQLTDNLSRNAGTLLLDDGFQLAMSRTFHNGGSLVTSNGAGIVITQAWSSDVGNRLSNQGVVTVGDGGTASFGTVDNLTSGVLTGKAWGTLSGGAWNVLAGSKGATLTLGTGEAITKIDTGTTVTLSGANAHFAQLENYLAEIDGSLEIDARSYTAQAALHNAGTLRVGAGGTVQTTPKGATSVDVTQGVLTGGAWEVVAGTGTAKLAIGTEAITTIGASASVLLSGAGSQFDQLEKSLTSNQGTLEVANGRAFRLGAGFTNAGDLIAESGGSFITSDAFDVGGGQLTVDGSLTTGGTVLSGGTLGGNGVLHGAVTLNGGTISPGHSPGLLTFADGLVMQSGTLAIQIGGRARGTQYDAIDGTNVTLGGTLDVSLYDLGSGLFHPQLGDHFDVVGANKLSGDFTSFVFAAPGNGLSWGHEIVTEGGRSFYRLDVLKATPVPLPAAWLLLASAGVLLRRRR